MSDNQDFIASIRWEHLQKKRYYLVMVSKDLFGDIVLTRAWGGIGQASGRITHLPCSSIDEAKKLLAHIDKTRQQRGYVKCQYANHH